MPPKGKAKAKGKGKAAAKPKVYDYSGLQKGMKLQAEIGGEYYSAEVVKVTKEKKWAKTPILVHWQGYGADSDEWVGGDRLRSKVLKEKKEAPKKEKVPKKESKEGEKKPRVPAVYRVVSYKCKAGKEKEFKALTDELAKDVGTDIEGLIVFDYFWPDPSTFSAAMLFKSQEMLDKYKTGVREKYLAQLGPMLDGPPKYDVAGPLSQTFRNREAKPEEGKEVMRVCSYKCKEGKEAEWKKHMEGMIMKAFRKEVQGYTVCRYGWSDEKTIFAAMCFESQEAFDKYKAGLREKYLEEMKELMDGTPVFDEIGPAPKTILPPSGKTNAAYRVVSYKCKAGKEKDFKELTEELAKDVGKEIEGLIVFDYFWPDPSTFSAAMLFKSQEMLDKYKAGVREKYLAQLGPMLDGPPKYDVAGPLGQTFRNRKAKPETGKEVMRICSYKCKEGKEAEWKEVMEGKLMKSFRKDVQGYTVMRYGWSDARTLFAAMCFESQEAFDKYKAGLREKYLEMLKELMEGAPVFDEIGPAPKTILPEKYFPKTVAEAWKNHFDAFGAQDLNKIMLDYDDDSIARVYNNVGETKSEFKGASEIKGMFEGLFKDLKDLKTLKAPVVDIEEDGRQVFLVWMCPGCGYDTATDTFIFRKVRGQFKISRQNIVITKK